jgi:branched-chain amino acid transport system permease protein
MLQILADGLIFGSIVALGAIGLSFTFSIFRFSNFSHGELLAWGAYLALFINTFIAKTLQAWRTPIHPFSFGWGFVVSMPLAAAATALLALCLDAILFRRLRKHGSITLVIASFGASLVLRNVLQYWQGGVPQYYSKNLPMAMNVVPRRFQGGLRFTPDQLLVVGLTLLTVAALHAFLRYSVLGRSMRATASNPDLARVTGIDPEKVYRAAWVIGGVLATMAGLFVGLTAQLRPSMGSELLLPLFAAVIVGGIGFGISSLWGAVLGGLGIGLAESASVNGIGSAYRAPTAFAIVILVLILKPDGLFGERT